jgi:hydroxymethylbilane synthase
MPLAAFSRWRDGVLHIDAAWGDEACTQALVRASAHASVATLAQAEALGQGVAAQLCAAGAVPVNAG